MVNFGPVGTVPEEFKDRKFYQHNPTVTLMRTTVEENRKLGEEIGRKAAAAMGPTCIMIPLKGVSAIDQTGKAFDDPAARLALYDGIRATHENVELVELDNHINDAAFAGAAAKRLLSLFFQRFHIESAIQEPHHYQSSQQEAEDRECVARPQFSKGVGGTVGW
ncbi:MAG: Tm-1-like ATP-binding domain-containing protein [Planctomycetaceae bacterium]